MRLSNQKILLIKVYLFTADLDEFGENLEDLVAFFKASNPRCNMKICVSSRP